jgi:hypothetical protein
VDPDLRIRPPVNSPDARHETTDQKPFGGHRRWPDGVPVACPIVRQIGEIHGHSRVNGHAADLRQPRWADPHPEPSKQRVAGSSPAWRTVMTLTWGNSPCCGAGRAAVVKQLGATDVTLLPGISVGLPHVRGSFSMTRPAPGNLKAASKPALKSPLHASTARARSAALRQPQTIPTSPGSPVSALTKNPRIIRHNLARLSAIVLNAATVLGWLLSSIFVLSWQLQRAKICR